MKKIFFAIMCLLAAATFVGCSSETSVTTETKVSVSTDELQDLLDKGDKNFDAGKYDDAIKNFTDAIKIDDECAAAYNGRGMAYGMKKDFDAAIKDFDQTIKLEPQNPEGYSNRGKAYLDKGDNQKALADFNKAIEIDPKYSNSYNNRGALYFHSGETEKAIADFKKAVELDPNNKQAAENLKAATAN